MKTKLLYILLFFLHPLFSQQMGIGFHYLETGNFSKAETFFKKIINEYPNNKTANLCYGRAVGLNGNPKKASVIFLKQLAIYPNDFELELNYAESLLWNKNFLEAEKKYIELLKVDNSSFAANLGYANTLSNLKKYPQALKQINKTVALDKTNTNALTSRKYIRLGVANQLAKRRDYKSAIILLEENLIDIPGDEESLVNIVNYETRAKNYAEAEKRSFQLKDSVKSFLKLSLLYHKQKKDKNALIFATKAREAAYASKDSSNYLNAEERYFMALLWNRKYVKAKKHCYILDSLYPTKTETNRLKAAFGMYTGDFKKGIENNREILDVKPNSVAAYNGLADAYHANTLDKQALETIKEGQRIKENDPNLSKLKDKIYGSYANKVEANGYYSEDSGGNKATSYGLKYATFLNPKTSVFASYNNRKTENTTTDPSFSATTSSFGAGLTKQITPYIKANLSAGTIVTKAGNLNYNQFTTTINVETKPLPRHIVTFEYNRTIQDFNAELLEQEIVMNNYGLTYNFTTLYHLGFYGNYILTPQSDGNTRNLLFASFYYTFTKAPILKAGINYQLLSFKEQKPLIYFSPKSYNAYEAFANLTGKYKKWSYAADGAYGIQLVEGESSNLYRYTLTLGYDVKSNFTSTAYYKFSNVQSAVVGASTFEYQEIGLKLLWILNRKHRISFR